MHVVCSLNLIERKVKLSRIYLTKWRTSQVSMTKHENIANYEVYSSQSSHSLLFLFVHSGFLVVSLDNITFATKYCTIVDGIFRIHKSRLSEQTDCELHLHRSTLSFPEERTRDIQFALIDEQVGTIFIRGNNIYSMGRLLNTLAKYVEITGSSQFIFTSPPSATSTPLSKHRQSSSSSSQPHIYSDVDATSSIGTLSQSNGKP